MRDLRFKNLQEIGIDFSSSFTQEEIILDTLKHSRVNHAVFYKGIICSGSNDTKGVALGAFLDNVKYHPSKVLFFDDHLSNVKNVGKEMNKRGIEYHGYWYRAADKLQPDQFDRKIAQIQLDHLLQNNEYLTVDEAEAILQKTHTAK